MSGIEAVVLAGGSGTRLWPASRRLMPKQFLPLAGGQSLLEATIARLAPLVAEEDVRIVGGRDQMLGPGYAFTRRYRVLLEPCARNTAPAVGLAALAARLEGRDPVQLVLPADHVIPDGAAFRQAVQEAARAAQEGWLVTFSIQPSFPATGYGYIQAGEPLVGEVRRVVRFVEKPPLEEAKRMLEEGGYGWNAGIFVWKASAILAEMEKHLPELAQVLDAIAKDVQQGKDLQAAVDAHFAKAPEISVDYGVLERSEKVATLPASFRWSDVGSWRAVYEVAEKDEHGNAVHGRVKLRDVKHSLIESTGRLVAAIGLEGMAVVETPDAVLVAPLARSEEVKQLVEELKREHAPEVDEPRRVHRPWGWYEVLLESEFYKIKRIEVRPGASLSLQRHRHRSEHWVVVSGAAEVVRGEETLLVPQGESTFIPPGVKHRLANRGRIPLRVIEVQLGEYLGEDDIERFEDDYGRG